MEAEQDGMRVSVSVSRKVNLGNYSSADLFLAVSNIEVGASEADMQEAIETSEVAFSVVERSIQQKVKVLLEQQQQVQQRRQERQEQSSYNRRPTPPAPKEVRP